MNRIFIDGEKVMTPEGKGEVMHYLPRTHVVIIKNENTGHIISMPADEVQKIEENK